MFKKNEWSLLWPFYLMALIGSSLSVTLPVWVVFLQHKFTFVQISSALSLQTLVSMICDIPTGALADIAGRKISVVSGIVFQGLLWMYLPFVDSAELLYLVFSLMGIFSALQSGSDKAWIIDWLNCNKEGGLIHEMFIKIQSLNSAGLMITSFLSSALLFFLNIGQLFYIHGSGLLLSGFILLFFAEERSGDNSLRRRRRLIREAFCAAKKGVYFLLSNRALLYLVIATSFAVCSKDFGSVAWQPLFVGLSLPDRYLGIVFSAGSFTGIIMPFISKKILRRIGSKNKYLAFTTLAEFFFLSLLYFISKPFFMRGIIVYMFVLVIADLQSPVGSLFFQSLVPGRIRATTASAQSTVFDAFSLLATVAGGHAMDNIGPQMTLTCFSFFLIPAAVFYLMIKDAPANLQRRINLAAG